jgi:hypothetical protein
VAQRSGIAAEIRRAGYFVTEQMIIDLRASGDPACDGLDPALPDRAVRVKVVAALIT